MDVWPTDECNQIKGTDGTIFPPFLRKEEGLESFAPDLCRSLAAFYVKHTKYDGIPVSEYAANLGDMSKNADEKCYCPTPETCLKKGVMDLYKCAGVPIYASLPHFFGSDKSYVKGIKGLTPDKNKHEIKILFEAVSRYSSLSLNFVFFRIVSKGTY
nr:sensory neurons membrane protein [Semanotus bifasciatus]